MPEIETVRDDLRALTGLHLWHAGLSNCSQRVRLILTEKQLPWTSHMIDLMAFEHATPNYQSIHPKGLVPLLIDNGRTIYDSNDIIEYLDRKFPAESLGGDKVRYWLDIADESQLALRTLSHELLLGDARRLDAATLARFERDHANREFYQFLRRFSTTGFDDATLIAYATTLSHALDRMELALAGSSYLVSDRPTLADFSWVVNIHRLDLFEFPISNWPNLTNWFDHMRQRPSYSEALLKFEGKLPVASNNMRIRRRNIFAHIPNRGALSAECDN